LSKTQRSAGKKPKPLKSGAASARNRGKRLSPRPGPGRPTAARVEAINRAILTAAYNQFLKSGYQDTQMEAVAAAAGISKRTLYDRYPNRYELLKAVVAEQTVIWTPDTAHDASDSSPDLRQRLKQRARRAMEYCCSGEYEKTFALFMGCPPMDDLRRVRYEVGHKRMSQVIASEILDLSPDLAMRPQAALQLAEMLMAMLYGWWTAHFGVRNITREEAQAYADHTVDVLFDGRSSWANA